MNVKVLQESTRITNAYNGSSHTGVDLGHSVEPMHVLSHSGGTVIMCVTGKSNQKGSTGNASYGNFIKVKHDSGYYTLYAHLKDVFVTVNQKIQEGEVIATMGDSGNAYGVHLHFEVFNEQNKRVDPTDYLTKNYGDERETENSGSTPETKITYTVVKGDNLWNIAKKYNMNWNELYEMNKEVVGSNPDLIHPGQILVIKN